MRELLHAHFGVTHGRREIAVDRTEVALTVDEHVAHREVLRHAYHGVVDRGVAVRMVFTDHVADDARRFLVRLVELVAELLHRAQHASSEEHTSELQSLMRISYDVFCLNKTTTHRHTDTTLH